MGGILLGPRSGRNVVPTREYHPDAPALGAAIGTCRITGGFFLSIPLLFIAFVAGTILHFLPGHDRAIVIAVLAAVDEATVTGTGRMLLAHPLLYTGERSRLVMLGRL